MDCTDIKALLSAILDGELDAETRHDTERHIASCVACRQLISEAEAVDAMIAADAQAMVAGTSINPEFEAAVLSRTVFTAGARTLNRWTSWTGWLAAAASITLAAWIWIMDHQRLDGYAGPTPIDRMPDGSTMNAGVRRSFTSDESQPQEVFLLTSSELQPVDAMMSPPTIAPLTTEVADVQERPARPAMSADDADTLYAASQLLDMLRDADDSSFADIEQVRRIAEYDNVLPRLAEARGRLPQADRPIVLAAESILLRTVRGPVSLDDMHELRDAITRLSLADQLIRLTPPLPPSEPSLSL